MKLGELVIMELPSQPHYKKIGTVIGITKPDLESTQRRFKYTILVDGAVLHDQLYEYFYEIEPRRFG